MLIPCPWCGNRDDSEFSYGGEASVKRQQLGKDISDKEWNEYIFIRKNIKGEHKERWNHSNGCRQWFNAIRNTTTNTFLQTSKPGENYINIKKENL